MASDTAMMGLLPTIKCSSCNMDVEISAMGEHVCANVSKCEFSRCRFLASGRDFEAWVRK
jgi:hypothetical protein